MGIAGDPWLMWGQPHEPQGPAQRPAEATKEPRDDTDPTRGPGMPPGVRVREAARKAPEQEQDAELKKGPASEG
jgi:hypothetical protein